MTPANHSHESGFKPDCEGCLPNQTQIDNIRYYYKTNKDLERAIEGLQSATETLRAELNRRRMAGELP